jgi:hypothetical protein
LTGLALRLTVLHANPGFATNPEDAK